MKNTILSVILIVWLLPLKSQENLVDHYETVVFDNDTWKYFIGNSEPDSGWRRLDFDELNWLEGTGGFGFGDNDDNTVIEQAYAVYLRKKFTVIDSAKIAKAILHVDYDDAFVAYINDVEIARSGISGDHPVYNTPADFNHEALLYQGQAPEGYTLDSGQIGNCLKQGENILAVQVHNRSFNSSDMSARVFLTFGMADTTQTYRSTPEWFEEPFVFTSSDLPIVIIKTENKQDIQDEPKINAHMKIIYNGAGNVNHVADPGNVYDGNIGIEIRGRYSAGLPQKPFGLETRDSLGNNLNISLLGMPDENDWILLANYNDKVFMRNTLAFHLFREMGHYAPRTEFCEVLLNDSYEGLYVFTEQIKRDNDRVNIASLDADDNAGDSLTGGYIFKIDYYTNDDSWLGSYSPLDNPGSQVYYVHHDPKPDELTGQQKDYIKNFVETFASVLYSDDFKDEISGYRAYVNVYSFIDYFIIGELSRNVDAYKKSCFYFKDRDKKGGLINSGPVWDFDWAWKDLRDGCTLFNTTDGSNWAYKITECSPWPTPTGWINRLIEDEAFANAIYNRYLELRETILSDEYLENYIDSVHTLVNEAQQRHYTRWQILGRSTGAPENAPQPDTYEGEIEKFKAWIDRRLTWLDANITEFKHDDVDPGDTTPVNDLISAEQFIFRMFPNPAIDYFYIESNSAMERVEIFNLSGKLVQQAAIYGSYSYRVLIDGLDKGLYLGKITFTNGRVILRKLAIK